MAARIGFLRTSSSASFTSAAVESGLVARVFERRLRVGFGLDHLLLGFRQIGLGLAQIVFLRGGVELHHHVSGLHQLARLAQRRDRQIAAHHGSGEHFGIPALQLSARRNRDGDVALSHARGRDFRRGLREPSVG